MGLATKCRTNVTLTAADGLSARHSHTINITLSNAKKIGSPYSRPNCAVCPISPQLLLQKSPCGNWVRIKSCRSVASQSRKQCRGCGSWAAGSWRVQPARLGKQPRTIQRSPRPRGRANKAPVHHANAASKWKLAFVHSFGRRSLGACPEAGDQAQGARPHCRPEGANSSVVVPDRKRREDAISRSSAAPFFPLPPFFPRATTSTLE
ncbi:hypothetical protein QR685DRAFT_123668 [Neurospora intermedia]|uniref:Uncharacterized protein n=1 Tax=Neurospora intermedia TaxID=5142 RepID=A0ABR3CZ51_NEUIN